MRMQRFYARAGRVPPGDCGAFGGSGGASPALAFLLLLALLSLCPCFLSCLSDVLGAHMCMGVWHGVRMKARENGIENG